MPVLVKTAELPTELVWEEGLVIKFGISKDTVGSKKLLMGHTIYPPGNINKLHYHWACEAGCYIIRGHLAIYGKDKKEIVVGPGDFYYNLQGEIHGQRNMSDTEEVEMVWTMPGIVDNDDSGTVFVE